jgi:hypothetical protein
MHANSGMDTTPEPQIAGHFSLHRNALWFLDFSRIVARRCVAMVILWSPRTGKPRSSASPVVVHITVCNGDNSLIAFIACANGKARIIADQIVSFRMAGKAINCVSDRDDSCIYASWPGITFADSAGVKSASSDST